MHPAVEIATDSKSARRNATVLVTRIGEIALHATATLFEVDTDSDALMSSSDDTILSIFFWSFSARQNKSRQ